MEAMKLLLGSDIGLLSAFTIVACVVIGFRFIAFAKNQAEKDAREAGK